MKFAYDIRELLEVHDDLEKAYLAREYCDRYGTFFGFRVTRINWYFYLFPGTKNWARPISACMTSPAAGAAVASAAAAWKSKTYIHYHYQSFLKIAM